MYTQFLTFGSIAKDELMSHPGLFQNQLDVNNLDKVNVFFMVDKLDQSLGGISTNIAYNFKQLSKKNCYILGGIGPDGQAFSDFFNQNDIKTKYLEHSSDLFTGTFKGISFLDQNQIGAFYYGANLEGKKISLSSINDIKNSLLALSSSSPEAVESIQKQAIEIGVDYLYDPGMMLTWASDSLLKEGILNCKYLIANDYEMNLIFERTGFNIQDLVSKNIQLIITKGKDGLDYYSTNQSIHLKSFPISNFVDPTGAGDSFRGGFAAYLLDQKPVRDCLIAGSVMGSLCVEKSGSVKHTFNQEVFNKRYCYIDENS